MKCPTCQSENIQKLSLAHKSGFANIENSTSGIGLGLSPGGLGVGIGKANTSGTQQTELSKDTRPPTRFNLLAAVFIYFKRWFLISIAVALLLAFTGVTQYENFILGVIFFGFFAAFLHRSYNGFQFNKHIYPDAIAQWNKGFICLKCSEVFVLTNKDT